VTLNTGSLSEPRSLIQLVALLQQARTESEERHLFVGNWLYCLRRSVRVEQGTRKKRRKDNNPKSGQPKGSSPHRQPHTQQPHQPQSQTQHPNPIPTPNPNPNPNPNPDPNPNPNPNPDPNPDRNPDTDHFDLTYPLEEEPVDSRGSISENEDDDSDVKSDEDRNVCSSSHRIRFPVVFLDHVFPADKTMTYVSTWTMAAADSGSGSGSGSDWSDPNEHVLHLADGKETRGRRRELGVGLGKCRYGRAMRSDEVNAGEMQG